MTAPPFRRLAAVSAALRATVARIRMPALALLLGAALAPQLATPATAQPMGPPVVRLAGEEWPPFVTTSLPANGMSGALVSAVFERLGFVTMIDYFPWKRTVELGLNDARYAGFLAVWRTPAREKLCHFSAPIGSTLTVLAYPRDRPLKAATLAQLEGARIGTVAGYANGEQFDALVRNGTLAVDEGVNDETNLRKLLNRRFAAIVIEKRVMRYLLTSGRFTKAERDSIAFSEQYFQERSVHVCFKRSPEGLARQQAFNAAARDMDLDKLERDYWRRMGSEWNMVQ